MIEVDKFFFLGIVDRQSFFGTNPYIAIMVDINAVHPIGRKTFRVRWIVSVILDGIVVQVYNAKAAVSMSYIQMSITIINSTIV